MSLILGKEHRRLHRPKQRLSKAKQFKDLIDRDKFSRIAKAAQPNDNGKIRYVELMP